jgi:rubrerythrin
MRFEQTRTILQQLAPDYHRRVSEFYQAMADGEVSPRVRLMLEYLIDHEQHRALALAEFCHGAPHSVLEHWLKGVEIRFPQARAEVLDAAAASDLDLLVKAAVDYKRTLIEYFSHLLERCNDPQVSNLFQKLKLQEEKAMKRMIRHAQGLADL